MFSSYNSAILWINIAIYITQFKIKIDIFTMQVFELLVFYLTYILLLFSIAGYGFSFNKLLKIDYSKTLDLL